MKEVNNMNTKSLGEIVRKYKSDKYDLSCSESFLHGANEFYNLGLDENSFKMMAGFSGGMYVENVCGIITSGIAVIGILFTDDVAHNSPRLKEISQKWIEEFNNAKKSIICSTLKDAYRSEVSGCNDLIIAGAEIFEKVIEKYL